MAEAGWVQRIGDARDARLTLVQATPKGRREVARLMTAAKAHEAEVLAGFGAGEVATLKALLRGMIDRSERPPRSG